MLNSAVMGLDKLPTEILSLIVHHFAHDTYSEPTSPIHLICFASTCKRLRALIYPEIWQNAKLMNFDPLPNFLLQKHAKSFTFACRLSDQTVTRIPGSILAYVQCLELQGSHELVQFNLSNPRPSSVPAYQLVRPEITPALSRLSLTSAVSCQAWEWFNTHLFRYPSRVRINLFASHVLPHLPSRLSTLVANLVILMPSYATKPTDFIKTWKSIGKMRNLLSLNVHVNLGESLLLFDTEAEEKLVIGTLLSLQKLKSLYLDNYPIPLPTNAPWLPQSTTTLECSTSNFVQAPNYGETSVVGPALFHGVKHLTMVIKSDQQVLCTRLPFRDLISLNLIGQRLWSASHNPDVATMAANLISDNPKIERLTVLVTWDFDLKHIGPENLLSITKLSLTFLQETLVGNTQILSNFFRRVTQIPNLMALALCIPNHKNSGILVGYDEFTQFLRSAMRLKVMDLSVQLTGWDAQEFTWAEEEPFFEKEELRETQFLQYVPIESLANSEASAHFEFVEFRKSLSFGQSWFLYFLVDLESFREQLEEEEEEQRHEEQLHQPLSPLSSSSSSSS